MPCPVCDAPVVSFSVPAEYRSYAPSATATAGVCTRCLTVIDAEEDDAEEDDGEPGEQQDGDESPDFDRISDAFPTGEPGVPFALALGLLDSLALHRTAIGELLERVERAGTDPLLAFGRLAAEPSLEPAVDLDRRIPQVQQLLYE